MDFKYYFKSRRGEMLSLLKELVSRESPTSDKKAVDACSSYVANQFKRNGAKTTRHPQPETGDFYIVEYPAKTDRGLDGQILILTHVDTVWPVGKIEKMPFYVSGDKVFGPGVLDMKAGLVLSLFALKTLNELNLRPRKRIVVFMNSAEETGCEASHKMIGDLAKRSDAVLCLEPALAGGGLKVQRKGRHVIRLEAFGKSAHGGSPEKGINAIEELVAQLRRIQTLKSKDISVNIGLVGGGEKPNVVPERAWAICDVRFWDRVQRDKVIGFLKKMRPTAPGARVRYSIESATPPMEKTPASSRLLLETKKIAAGLGLSLDSGKSGGGSDASIASSLGIATIDGLGPEGEGIHADDEHLVLSSLVERAALLVELLRQL